MTLSSSTSLATLSTRGLPARNEVARPPDDLACVEHLVACLVEDAVQTSRAPGH
jgi:hypothetical protein